MRPSIEGDYTSGNEAVRIERARQKNWQTAYSSGDDAAWQRLPVFTREYVISLPHNCIGIAQFDGKCLVGYFQPSIVANGRWENGILVALPYTGGPMLCGQFTATLRDDGNFDVVIAQFDGRDPGKPSKPTHGPTPFMFEPETERVEAVWVRQM
jgi:hypothetical protein